MICTVVSLVRENLRQSIKSAFPITIGTAFKKNQCHNLSCSVPDNYRPDNYRDCAKIWCNFCFTIKMAFCSEPKKN